MAEAQESPDSLPEVSIDQETQEWYLATFRGDFSKQRSLFNPNSNPEELARFTGRIEVWEQVLRDLGLDKQVAQIRQEEQTKINAAKNKP